MNVAALLALNGVGVDVAGQLLVTAGGPNAAPPKACPRKRSFAASSAWSPERSTTSYNPQRSSNRPHRRPWRSI